MVIIVVDYNMHMILDYGMASCKACDVLVNKVHKFNFTLIMRFYCTMILGLVAWYVSGN